MNPICTLNSKRGQIKMFSCENDNILFVIPQGCISKQLLKQFLKELKIIDDQQINRPMHHIVDTSKIVFANPLNPFYLRAIKKLNNIGWYIVIVPNPLLRIVVYLTKWINNPDFVFSSMDECKVFIKKQAQSNTK